MNSKPAEITLLIATRNSHKVREIRTILGSNLRYLTLDDFPGGPKVIEDANTFAGNATKKAVELAQWLALGSPSTIHYSRVFVLSDDSGLEVDALDGAPGVHSARFAAQHATSGNSSDTDNSAKLLRLLDKVPLEKRTARFRCVMALVDVENQQSAIRNPQLFDAVCRGHIAFEPRGQNGFGYDPLFVPDGFNQTFAEMGDDVKNKLSHRAKALEKLQTFIQNLT